MELQFKAKVFIFVCVGSAIFFLMYVIQLGMPKRFEPVKLYFERKSSTCNATAEQGTKPTLLLVYTTFFGDKEWVPRVEKCPRRSPCNISSFEVIYDKQRFSESDVVLFHARDMTDVGELNKLLKRKPCSQRWAYFLMESPNATPDTGRLNGFFNLTWTFRSDSDIWAPYGTYYTKTPDEISTAQKNFSLQDFSQGKSKLVSWMVSNCGPALRKEVVHQLQKYVQVDVFGGCSGEFGGSKNCPKGDSCRSTMQQYKFYLAFENALCEDYITEKYWRHLGEENVIPVVMGGANYSKLAIPGSYINVMDFKTVKELAEYLQYLDKNNTAYNEYFTWRRKYEKLSRPLLCELCLAMGTGTTPQPKVYNNLNEYWFGQGKCNQKDQSVRNMFQS